MPEPTEAKPNQTSEGDGKNSVGTAEGTGATQNPPKTEDKPEAKFTQAELDKIVQKRLKEEGEKTKRKADEEAAKAAGEHEKLANTYKTERDDFEGRLSTLQERHDALTEVVGKLVKGELKALPESVRELKPSDDPLQLLEWIPKAKELAGKLSTSSSPAPGNGRDPKPAGTAAVSKDQLKSDLLRSGRYSGF